VVQPHSLIIRVYQSPPGDLNVRKSFVARMIAPALVVAGLSLTPPCTVAQEWVVDSVCPDNVPAVFHKCAMETARSFDPPRMPDGRPNIGGSWQLPGGQIGGAYEDLEEHPGTLDDLGGPNAVVDPPDGNVPMHSWADARKQENVEQYVHQNAACFLGGVPNTMYHGGARQFLQTPDYLVILSYNAHAYRIIPLDGRSGAGENIRLWNGDSSGHWEGDTLVIETTNQNARPWLDQRGRFYTEDARVVERLTLIDPDTIHYQATLEDPNVFSRPFTIALPYRRITEERYEIEELACYENNAALMELYRTVGFGVYPGITPEEARGAMGAEQ